MKKEVIVSAKSVEEAVAKAVAELGAPSADKIEYTVVEEAKKGYKDTTADGVGIRIADYLNKAYEYCAQRAQ